MAKVTRPESQSTDLSVETFFVLREAFFDDKLKPSFYPLRDKRNTQDDPFDESVHKLLSEKLPKDIQCKRAPGPLITPDMVIRRPKLCIGVPQRTLTVDLSRIFGMEIKKLERMQGGTIARASGMDYNTTPPCGTVRIYNADGSPLDIRGFYLFVCQEAVRGRPGRYNLSALVLCDGNLLNADFEYYLSIVGERTKEVGIGTYGNGANRTRPMLIFANPLGVPQLDHNVTLIHSKDDMEGEFSHLRLIGTIGRSIPKNGESVYYCYRLRNDIPRGHVLFKLKDPFPTPIRTQKTQPRGRFRIDMRSIG